MRGHVRWFVCAGVFFGGDLKKKILQRILKVSQHRFFYVFQKLLNLGISLDLSLYPNLGLYQNFFSIVFFLY